MPRNMLRLLSRVALPVMAAACAGPALAQTVEGTGESKVMMFERPPTVDELREVVKPADPPIRTRSIEIMGSGVNSAQRPRQTESANYGAGPAAAQPEPARPQRQQTQEAAAPAAPAPAAPAPRKAPRTQAMPAAMPAEQQPAAQPQQGQQQPGAFGFRINFPFNSAEIPREFYPYIDAVGGLMSQDPQLRLVIEGHTDGVGSDQYNLVLSERRAVSVGEYLVRMHQVEPQRIAIAGQGESAPLTPDPNDSRNRRVEFKPVR